LGDLQQRCIIQPIQDQVARLDSQRGATTGRCEDAFAFRIHRARIKSGEFDLDLGGIMLRDANHQNPTSTPLQEKKKAADSHQRLSSIKHLSN